MQGFTVVYELNIYELKFFKVIFGKTTGEMQMLTPYLNSTMFTGTSHTLGIQWLRILPDGTLASASDDKTIKIWSTSGTVTRTLTGHTGSVVSLEVLPNGLMASTSADKSIRLWNITTGLNVGIFPGVHSATILLVNTINDCYFITGSDDFTAKVS